MDALDLIAKIKMDLAEYEEGLDKAKSSAEKSGSSISGAFGKVASGVGTAMATAAKATAVAVGAAVTGIATLTTKAVQSYADYEQLVGGVETLFGAGGQSLEQYAESVGTTVDEAKESYDSLMNAQETVLKNADNAYKTAGLSANEYMETVTGMAAALTESLGGNTEVAAEKADMAITDMSDNANKMGTSMESIQNAYSGFAKGNYTMLDNLKLGYGGTKEEMQRLLDKAEELSGIEYDISSYSDIVDAIHVVQTEMGITGTTAKEATETISGSANMMKSAWENLVTGIGDSNADLDGLMDNLVESIIGKTEVTTNGVKTHVNGFIDNIIPVIETSLSSIGTLIEELVPKALEVIPTLITNVLPNITTAATELVSGLVSAMSENMDSISSVVNQLLEAFLKLLPDILTLGGQIVSTLASAIGNNLDSILDAAGDILEQLLTGLANNAEKLATGAVEIITKFVGFLTENADLLINAAISIAEGLLTGLVSNWDTFCAAGMELLQAILQGLFDALPDLLGFIPDLVDMFCEMLTNNFDTLLSGATELFLALVEALPEVLIALTQALPKIIDSIVEFLTGDGATELLEAALMMFLEIVAALPEILGSLLGALGSVIQSLMNGIISYKSNIKAKAAEMLNGIMEAIPEVGADILRSLSETIESWVTAIGDTVGDWADAGKNLILGLWNGISDKAQWLYNQITSLGSGVISRVKSLFGIKSPSRVFADIGANLVYGLEEGWEDNIDDATKSMTKGLDNMTSSFDSTLSLDAKTVGGAAVGTGSQNQYITLYATTTLDGKKVGESTYNFIVDKINNQQRALAVAQGGYY